ncbi:MAG: class I SAM-dependent rRNA methyltransferase [Myxococcota bacterium]|nr:class I SAM-dependent rRNA methyltransferase [Myxococcota bacterium]
MRQTVREIVLRQRPPGAAEQLLRGHPWVWRETIASGLDAAVIGEEVQVISGDGSAVGRGLVDPTSPIAVRVWTRERKPIDPALLESRAMRACAVRAALLDFEQTNAFRVVHGEGDRMPGFVVDRYGSVAVARTDGEAAASRVGELADAIGPSLESWGVRSFVHRIATPRNKGEAPRFDLLRGGPPPDVVHVREHGVPFVVDLKRGQKTGAFLDQRDNRRLVGQLARGRRVLNLFSYAGGFSLHAALGGAAHVTSVDIAAAAHATAQASFRLANLDPSVHRFVAADVSGFLDGARRRGDRWDLIVSDPPSFAPSEKALGRALSAYRALHRGCAEVLAPEGVLCASSCSSHVDAQAFLGTLDDVALGGRALSVLELRQAGPDHPTLAAFPEGRYLKFAVLA